MKFEIPSEKFNFKSTLFSHGWVFLAPYEWCEISSTLKFGIKLKNDRNVDLKITSTKNSLKTIAHYSHGKISRGDKLALEKIVRRIFKLDVDLSGFYSMCEKDLLLKFVCDEYLGRIMRCPTVFEDLIKTICTTNCSWNNTKLMVRNLCDLESGFFPSPKTILDAGEEELRKYCRLGYRARSVFEVANKVVWGDIDIEGLSKVKNVFDLKNTLLSLHGVGDYSVKHMLVLLGHYSEIPVDSEVIKYISKTHFNNRKISMKEAIEPYQKYGDWKYLAYKFERIGKKLNYIN